MNRLPIPKRLLVAGAIGSSVVAGGVLGATVLGPTLANAATASPTASSTASPSTGAAAPAMPPHGSQAHESAELPVTGDNATKAQAAAVKAVGSGTAGAVTTDFTKNGYEVTVTKSDDTSVEIHLDSSFNVMQGHGGGNDNDADDSGSSSGTGG